MRQKSLKKCALNHRSTSRPYELVSLRRVATQAPSSRCATVGSIKGAQCLNHSRSHDLVLVAKVRVTVRRIGLVFPF
jgi:hypothetical protein